MVKRVFTGRYISILIDTSLDVQYWTRRYFFFFYHHYSFCMLNSNILMDNKSVFKLAMGILMIFSYFSKKIGFDISCKLCVKCQNLFSEKNKIK